MYTNMLVRQNLHFHSLGLKSNLHLAKKVHSVSGLFRLLKCVPASDGVRAGMTIYVNWYAKQCNFMLRGRSVAERLLG